MADDNNPLADIYNAAALPYMLGPNKYSAFNGNPLSLQGYAGTPTDAQGRPIQSFVNAQQQHDAWNAANPAPAASAATPGTTLNSNPYGSMFGALAGQSPGGPDTQAQYAYNQGLGGVNPGSAQGRAIAAGQQTAAQPNIPTSLGGQQPQQSAAPAQQNPVDMRQAYLTALSNPGPVTTPGANAPQSAPAGQQPNVLDSFLQKVGQPAQPGAGGYSNAPFFKTLQGLRQGAMP